MAVTSARSRGLGLDHREPADADCVNRQTVEDSSIDAAVLSQIYRTVIPADECLTTLRYLCLKDFGERDVTRASWWERLGSRVKHPPYAGHATSPWLMGERKNLTTSCGFIVACQPRRPSSPPSAKLQGVDPATIRRELAGAGVEIRPRPGF